MKKSAAFLFVVAFIALTGIGKDWMGGHAMTSRESVEKALMRMNVRIGGDAERGRIVAVGTSGFSMQGEKHDDEEELNETYDFPDDENDDFETKRFKTVWKAYANGLAAIAQMMVRQIDYETIKGEVEKGKKEEEGIISATQLRLDGVVTVTSAESIDVESNEYEFTVAVCQSTKRRELYKNNLIGDQPGRPGRHSLKEWIDENSSTGIICPQSFIDNEGVCWRVAGVPVEVGAGARAKGRAKYYAYEAALRTIWVDVDASISTSVSSVYKGGVEKLLEKFSRQVSIKPICSASYNDPFCVKWLELDKVDCSTGKPIRLIVCAIRDDAGAREESKAFLVEMIKKNQKDAYERGRREALKEASRKANGTAP